MFARSPSPNSSPCVDDVPTLDRAVRIAEHAEAVPPIGRLPEATAEAVLVVPHRHDEEGQLGDVDDGAGRLGEVPVDEPHRSPVAPDRVPGTEVPVNHDLVISEEPSPYPPL